MKTKTSLFTLLLIFAVSSGNAQIFDKYAGEFMTGGVGSRYLGMGNNAVSFISDPFSVYWNPSGLAKANNPEISFMHNERFSGLIKFDFIAFSYPYNSETTLGFGVLRNGIDDIADTRNGWDSDKNQPKEGFVPSYFNSAIYVVYGSLASTRFLGMPIGATAKIIRQTYGSVASAWGFGLDVGTQFTNVYDIEDLKIGLVAHDVTSTLLTWNTGKSELISPSIESGISYSLPVFVGRTLFSVGMINRFENRKSTAQINIGPVSGDFKAGLEYNYIEKFNLRVGMNELKRFNVGAGIKVKALWIDYAFEYFNNDESLGNSHRISFSLALDKISRPE